MKIKPKKLRKITDGRIFNYSETLAQMPDMEPVWPDGIDPNVPIQNEELNTEDIRSNYLEKEISVRDEQLQAKDAIIQQQAEEISSLTEELQKALSQLHLAAEANRKK